MPIILPERAWFGLTPPEQATAAWGARAIITGAYLDLVPDRRQCDAGCAPDRSGPTSDLHLELHRILEQFLLPEVRRRLKAHDPDLDQKSDAVTTIQSGRVTLVCSPRASYGYLYLVAYIADETPVMEVHGG